MFQSVTIPSVELVTSLTDSSPLATSSRTNFSEKNFPRNLQAQKLVNFTLQKTSSCRTLRDSPTDPTSPRARHFFVNNFVDSIPEEFKQTFFPVTLQEFDSNFQSSECNYFLKGKKTPNEATSKMLLWG
jgi:hypothetical protein